MNVPEMFGSMVFNDNIMREMLPKKVYQSLKNTMVEGKALDEDVADIVAAAMKEWAVSKGATHFTHWFQPMTGVTAEKHDSFLTVDKSGSVIMDFSGKELIKGEPDASSFPSGGLRATFEARGYTAWDPTSYAFIKDDTLCIPTAFCSYTGQILDKKTPLLRSMDVISKEAVRALSLFGKNVKRVNATIGAEQEYFLIDKNDFAKRLDLKLTGRTLVGAAAAKGQEMEDHYFGSIRPRVKAFMADLDEELWKLGITAKTEHNEVAPCQHEMAPIYDNANKATDANQLTMEMMKKVAERHGFACLLHEKPFEGINGSGKHNNWALSTDDGENLLDPGRTPEANAQFLLFLTAIIKAVDEYQDLLRISVASAGNDHRLGANEAPPAIVSIFVGDELESVISSIVDDKPLSGKTSSMRLDIGTSVLPKLARDNSDRNRTSPFAFTGNKFEFRMPGSSFNIACTNVMLNTAVADALASFCDELEGAADFNASLSALIRRELKAHRRILFNGNGYSKEWEEEAERRGLANYKRTPDALVHYCDEKNIALFSRHRIYTREEMESRLEISLDEYQKAIHIEASTMLEILRRQVLPAVLRFSSSLASSVQVKKEIGVTSEADKALCSSVSSLANELLSKCDELDKCIAESPEGTEKAAFYAADCIIPLMEDARGLSDKLESITDKSYWPFPTYSDILFY
ncbi:MAG: glutamine synthetase III [Spirochaetes bacterium]|uniref:Glutamine synthetase III n=1 Tax=Candidatus Ornithospirochaeta stercoripullorum TaxID=2840899 RepID=A0A9D9H694_9SPIO|nr:glutamine synthetase III [Candidatus Ornithospirochaeta stercoripullorum]